MPPTHGHTHAHQHEKFFPRWCYAEKVDWGTNYRIISFFFQIKMCLHRRQFGRTQTKLLTVVLTRWQTPFCLSALCKMPKIAVYYWYVKDFCNFKTNMFENMGMHMRTYVCINGNTDDAYGSFLSSVISHNRSYSYLCTQ